MIWRMLYLGIVFLFIFEQEFALADTNDADNFKLSGFVDSYLAYDPSDQDYRTEDYLTQPHRSSEPNINLAYIRTDASTDSYRARLSIQAGSSVEVNYASEPNESLRFIQEAFVGYQLSEHLWLDAGIYLSHIGFESFISKDNWAYTRLLLSEFSPYYQSGARLSYDPDGPLSYQLHIINGWQNISDLNGRTALGAQVAYPLAERSTIVFNTFTGKELEGLRMFGDLVATFRLTETTEFALIGDIGNQQRQDSSNDQWFATAALLRYHINSKLRLIPRIEYYSDPEQVIVRTISKQGFETAGASIGIDYEAIENLLLRIEYRKFVSREKVYRADSELGFRDSSSLVVISIAYSF